jgi:hypothetical protein
MSHSFIKLQFDDEGDGTGKLIARAEAGSFAGQGGAYFSTNDLEAFAAALTVFPLPDQFRPSVAGGSWKKDGSGELDQELLGLTAYPINQRGYVGMQIRIASEIWERDRPECQKAVRLEVVTTHEPLVRFSQQLIAVVRGIADEAVLEGEEPM